MILKYWSLTLKYAKFAVKKLENIIITEVKFAQVVVLFFVEQFKANFLKPLFVTRRKNAGLIFELEKVVNFVVSRNVCKLA